MKSNFAHDADDLREKDRRHTVHGWTDYSKFVRDGPEILVEGDGVYVTDSCGNRLMDAMAGVWCVNVGYGRTEIVDAIATQARCLPFANPFRATSSPPAAELSARLAALAPGDLDHVLYSGGGSTANDAALRIVQRYFNTLGQVDKKGVISRRSAYHGSTSASASLGGIDTVKTGFDVPAAGVHYVSAPYAYREADGAGPDEFRDRLVEEFAEAVERVGAERIGCFFAEPVMGMGGVLIPPPGYFRRISEICKANDILIVADEVVTGFGRLGAFLASQAIFEMSPDIITCAKGLTSGYQPLGATIISSRIMDVLGGPTAEGGIFTHGFTYAEHPSAAPRHWPISTSSRGKGSAGTFGRCRRISRRAWKHCWISISSATCAARGSCSRSRTSRTGRPGRSFRRRWTSGSGSPAMPAGWA